jgi:hypothetical protein
MGSGPCCDTSPSSIRGGSGVFSSRLWCRGRAADAVTRRQVGVEVDDVGVGAVEQPGEVYADTRIPITLISGFLGERLLRGVPS